MMTLKKKIIFPLVIGLGLLMSLNAFAGDPPPVGGDPSHDPGSTPIGGSAPIGEGYLITIGIVLLYGTVKYFSYNKLIENN